MVNNVLLIAYHYPPIRVSSGVQRTLAFSKYLARHGWKSIVLTVHPRAYEQVSDDQLKDIPSNIIVKRAFALDARRHLSVGGKYLEATALPDRWLSWWFGGVLSGLMHISKYRPKIIWSTYPIATAHLIALTLNKITGIPWVADFRDSMTEPDYPREKNRRKIFCWLEKKAVYSCDFAVFTTPGAVRMYKERYPNLPDSKWKVLPNGYNEEIFSEIEESIHEKDDIQRNYPITLVHSGVIYPSERDPRPFFNALSELLEDGVIKNGDVRIILRATGHDDLYFDIIKELNIDNMVFLEPGVSYRDALKEMLSSDGLLVFQASNCNHQIPAKIYEYFRSRRPILALTDPKGDTAKALLSAGINSIAPLDNKDEIKNVFVKFIRDVKSGNAVVALEDEMTKYSRQSASGYLAKWFDEIISKDGGEKHSI